MDIFAQSISARVITIHLESVKVLALKIFLSFNYTTDFIGEKSRKN